MNILNKLSSVKISKICRICLVESKHMRSIFSKLTQSEILEENVVCLSDVLKRITAIPVNGMDSFPQLVCSNCISLIHAAYKFKIQFDNSYNLLQQYYANIKEEVIEASPTSTNSLLNYSLVSKVNLPIDTQVLTIIHNKITNKVQKSKGNKNPIFILSKPSQKLPQGEIKQIKEDTLSKCEKEEIIKTYPCPVCTREFPALELRQHAHTHKALKKYLDIPADKKVKPGVQFYADNSTSEFISIHNRKEKIHRCVMCNETFTAVEFCKHLDTHKNEKEYKCDQCDRVFKRMNHLNTHRIKHLEEYPFKCEQCGKGFVIEANYDCHMLTHNSNQELPYECVKCMKRFYNPGHLYRHMIQHTENISYSLKYRVCKCYHCLKPFKDRDAMKAHKCVPIPKNQRAKYPCKDCDKVFKNPSSLYSHIRIIHKADGGKILCSVCGLYVSNIYNHMMRHNGQRPHPCPECGKRFSVKPKLTQHLLVHSGLKPFNCSVCSKAFNNHNNLTVHERIHKGNKCHICKICNKGFLEKSYLKKHMNVHAKI